MTTPVAWYRVYNGQRMGVSFERMEGTLLPGWSEHPLIDPPTDSCPCNARKKDRMKIKITISTEDGEVLEQVVGEDVAEVYATPVQMAQAVLQKLENIPTINWED